MNVHHHALALAFGRHDAHGDAAAGIAARERRIDGLRTVDGLGEDTLAALAHQARGGCANLPPWLREWRRLYTFFIGGVRYVVAVVEVEGRCIEGEVGGHDGRVLYGVRLRSSKC